MTVDLSIVIAVGGLALSAATFAIGRLTSAKNSGVADGELKTDVKYIRDSINKQEKKLDMVVENYSEVKTEIMQLKERLHALEEKVEYLHGGGGA